MRRILFIGGILVIFGLIFWYVGAYLLQINPGRTGWIFVLATVVSPICCFILSFESRFQEIARKKLTIFYLTYIGGVILTGLIGAYAGLKGITAITFLACAVVCAIAGAVAVGLSMRSRGLENSLLKGLILAGVAGGVAIQFAGFLAADSNELGIRVIFDSVPLEPLSYYYVVYVVLICIASFLLSELFWRVDQGLKSALG
jgi:hypothetical protein